MFKGQKGVVCVRRDITMHVLVAVLIILLSSAAFANSGPTYWQGYPSAGTMAVDGIAQSRWWVRTWYLTFRLRR